MVVVGTDVELDEDEPCVVVTAFIAVVVVMVVVKVVELGCS